VEPMPATVRNNPARTRYELEVDGHLAVAVYTLAPGVITFVHTEVPKELGGRGVGTTLARGCAPAGAEGGRQVLVHQGVHGQAPRVQRPPGLGRHRLKRRAPPAR
jgi:predicted GNAT family acetyltransferase